MHKTIAEIDQAYANESAQIGHKLYNRKMIDREVEAHYANCDALGREKRELFEKQKLDAEAQKIADQLLMEGAKNVQAS